MWRGFLILSLMLFCLNPAVAQSEQYTFFHTTYTTDNGLSSLFVRDIYQDIRKFIWVATDYGINRFDGHQFIAYSQVNTSFQSDNINHIREDQQGNLWLIDNEDQYIGAACSWIEITIDIFNPITETATSFTEYTKGNAPFSIEMIANIVQDDQQQLWITTHDGRLFTYGETFVEYPIPTELTKDAVFYPLSNEELLVVLQNALVRIKKEGSIISSTPFFREVREVIQDHQGRIFLKSYLLEDARAHLLNLDGSLEPLNNGLKTDGATTATPINRLGIDQEGKIWMGESISGKVTIKVDGKRIENQALDKFTLKEGFTLRTAFNLDRSGGVWYSDRVGLNYMRLNQRIFQTYFGGKPISTRAMFPLNDSILFVNTYNGNFKVNIESGYYEPFEAESLTSISQDGLLHQGIIYNSCYGSLICKIDPNEGIAKNIYIKGVKTNTNTLALSPDSLRVLIGTTGGLYWLDLQTDSITPFDQYHEFSELANLQINDFELLDDQLYILTERGLYRMDWETGITAIYHFSFDNLFHLHRDEEGMFWISTRGGGLIKWKPGGDERRFTTEDGLTHGTVYAAYPDNQGNLWLPSSKGVMCFNKEKETVHSYFEENGLPVNEFNQYAHLQWQDGSILFGGLNGIARFYPEQLLNMREASSKAPLMVTECSLLKDNEPLIKVNIASLTEGVELELGPEIKTLVIKFALLEFDQVVKPRYAYKLLGIDKQWNYLKENVLRLNHLPSGSYTLQVRAEAGLEAYEKELRIPITFKQAFTESWPFFGLCALGFIIIGISLARYRIYRLDLLNQRLDQEVQVRIKEIEQDKILISRQYEEMEKLNQTKDRLIAIIGHDLKDYVSTFQGIEKKVNYLLTTRQLGRIPKLAEYIENSAHDLSLLLDNLLNWALKERGDLRLHPDSVNVYSILEGVTGRLNKFILKKEIILINNIPDDLTIYVDNLTLDILLRNIIHNAIKFSHRGGTIEIYHSLTDADPNLVQVHIRDYGLGMTVEQKERLFTQHDYSLSTKGTENEAGTGMGLILCRELLQIQSGRLSVSSEQGNGTVFTIVLPHKLLPTEKVIAL